MKSFLFFLILAKFSEAQNESFYIGFKLSPNLTFQETILNNKKYSSQEFGKDIGMLFNLDFGKNISFLFEPAIHQNNFLFESEFNNKYQQKLLKTSSIVLPLIFRFKLGKEVHPYFDLGVYKKILISHETTNSTENSIVTPELETRNTGLIYGFGVENEISPAVKLNIGLRNYLLTDKLFKDINTIQNKYFQLSMNFGILVKF